MELIAWDSAVLGPPKYEEVQCFKRRKGTFNLHLNQKKSNQTKLSLLFQFGGVNYMNVYFLIPLYEELYAQLFDFLPERVYIFHLNETNFMISYSLVFFLKFHRVWLYFRIETINLWDSHFIVWLQFLLYGLDFDAHSIQKNWWIF